MKKLIKLLIFLSLTLITQAKCNNLEASQKVTESTESVIYQQVQLVAKNAYKTAVYATGTALTSYAALNIFLQAEEAQFTKMGENIIKITTCLFGSLEDLTKVDALVKNSKSTRQALLALSGALALGALYSGYKALESTYKTLTFEE